jgi:hypothetical protein
LHRFITREVFVMRYNQPYGTPEPPLGSYPRYINGNPTTGTEGSIPPARAIDEPQIEIVEVISRAQAALAAEGLPAEGLIPTHDNLHQLWDAIQALIAKKYIASHITKTVHGAGADFPDLHAALRWASEYTILSTGFLTLSIPAGQYFYTESVEISHPQAQRIEIVGQALKGASPRYFELGVSGYHSSTDGTAHINLLRSRYSTELAFTGGVNGFEIRAAGCTLRYLLVSGSQTIAAGSVNGVGGPSQGCGIRALANIYLDGIAIWGFGSVGIQIYNCTAYLVSSLNFIVSFCGWQGMTLSGGAFLSYFNAGETILHANAVAGITNMGGLVWADMVSIRGHGPPNGNAAVHSEQGGMVIFNGRPGVPSFIAQNHSGVIVAGGATYLGEYSVYQTHATYAFWAYGRATAWLDYSTFQGNVTQDVYATNGAYVELTGSSYATGVTPPPNTYNVSADGFIFM